MEVETPLIPSKETVKYSGHLDNLQIQLFLPNLVVNRD